MNWQKIKAWLRQPTTIHGLAVILGGGAAAVAHLVGGNSVVDGISAVALYAATNVVVSDNSADIRPVEKLIEDAVTAVVTRRIAQELPQLAADVEAALASLAAKPTARPPAAS
jgi:hypothetical protein